ncbi:Transcription factor TFIID complex subunit 8 C-term domain containing protein [Elaphomyces granulatus]
MKRSSSDSLLPSSDEPFAKHQKRSYHHHHRLQKPFEYDLREAAITDESTVAHLMNQAIGRVLSDAGFCFADPVALNSLQNATEEFMLRLVSYVRQSMIASRRTQPIPPDFESALKRSLVNIEDLSSYIKPLKSVEPVQTLLLSPPPESNAFTTASLLDSPLNGEETHVRSPYIPKHFPGFPSRHTYQHTPVFTEQEYDPRKIRERATEDGRHGEEALRRLARAAFKDSQSTGAVHREKRLWGRNSENMESMFEKTVKSIVKKAQTGTDDTMITDNHSKSGSRHKPLQQDMPMSIHLGPVVNCERDFWRKREKE